MRRDTTEPLAPARRGMEEYFQLREVRSPRPAREESRAARQASFRSSGRTTDRTPLCPPPGCRTSSKTLGLLVQLRRKGIPGIVLSPPRKVNREESFAVKNWPLCIALIRGSCVHCALHVDSFPLLLI